MQKPRLIFILLCLLFTTSIYSQSLFLTSENPRYQYTENIYKSLVQVAGILNEPNLQIEKRGTQNLTGRYNPVDHTITIEEEIMDLLANELAKDSTKALAFILAHELAHFSNDHNRKFNFLGNTTYNQAEIEADSYGLSFCAYANYDITIEMVEQTLDVVYENYYQKGKDLTLQERKKQVRNTFKRWKEFIWFFEAGNFLMAIEEFELAANCFNNIYINDFKSPEILNNTGVAYTRHALQLLNTHNLSTAANWWYPLEFNDVIRITPTKGTTSDVQVKKEAVEYLEKARKFLNEALELDRENCGIFINLTSIKMLLQAIHNKKSGTIYPDYQLNCSSELNQANLWVLKGIRAILSENDSATAKSNFQQAQSINATFAGELNLSILAGEDNPYREKEEPCGNGEYINDFLMDNLFLNVRDFNQLYFKDSPEMVYHSSGLSIAIKRTIKNNAIALLLTVDDSRNIETETYNFGWMSTQNNYKGASCKGIRIGDSLTKLEKDYGIPEGNINTFEKKYLRYTTNSVIFQLNRTTQQVDNWMTILLK